MSASSSASVNRERLRRGNPTGQITVVCDDTRTNLTWWSTREVSQANTIADPYMNDNANEGREVVPIRLRGHSSVNVENLITKLSVATAMNPDARALVEHAVQCQQHGGISFRQFPHSPVAIQLFVDNADLLPDNTLVWLLGLKKLANVCGLPWDVVLTAPDFQKLANRAYRLYEDSCMLLRSEPLNV